MGRAIESPAFHRLLVFHSVGRTATVLIKTDPTLFWCRYLEWSVEKAEQQNKLLESMGRAAAAMTHAQAAQQRCQDLEAKLRKQQTENEELRELLHGILSAGTAQQSSGDEIQQQPSGNAAVPPAVVLALTQQLMEARVAVQAAKSVSSCIAWRTSLVCLEEHWSFCPSRQSVLSSAE